MANFRLDQPTIGSSPEEDIQNLHDTLMKYRKELNFLLMNLDQDNVPVLGKFMEDSEGNFSEILQTIELIELRVGNNEGDISRIQIKADEIELMVLDQESSIATLSLRADEITLEVAALDGGLDNARSLIRQNADNIELRVQNDKVISSINISPESIQIRAERVNIQGAVTFSSLKTDLRDSMFYPGTTTIDGGNIRTNTIGARSIKTDELIVGDNIIIGREGRDAITVITEDTIATTNVYARYLQVDSARIQGILQADQITTEIGQVNRTLRVGSSSQEGTIILASNFTDGGIEFSGESVYITAMTSVQIRSLMQRGFIVTDDIFDDLLGFNYAFRSWGSGWGYIDVSSTGIAVRNKDGVHLGNIPYQ